MMHLRIMFTHEGEVFYSIICPFHRYLYRNQIKELPPRVFDNNSELIKL